MANNNQSQENLTLSKGSITSVAGDTDSQIRTTLLKKILQSIKTIDLNNLSGMVGNIVTQAGAATGNQALTGIGGMVDATSGIVDVIKNWQSLKNIENSKGKSAAKLSNTSSVAQVAGNMADQARTAFFQDAHQNDSSLTEGLNTTYDAVSSAMMGFSPIGTIIGGAMKVGAFASDALKKAGVGTDQMTTTDRVLDSNFMKLTPTGLVNAIGARKTQQFGADQDMIASVGGDYGGTTGDIYDAEAAAGKKYGLFSGKSRRRANSSISNARAFQNKMQGIADDAYDRQQSAASMTEMNYLRYIQNMNGGDFVLSAKQGGNLSQHINVNTRQIEDNWQPEIVDIEEFKQGGVISWEPTIYDAWEPIIELFQDGGKIEKEELTPQKNVIPEGALHKNKHHMENAEGLTKKGIPVIDNDGDQQAEIEQNEIIFSLEVTKKLESLYKSYEHDDLSKEKKDELAIEAGKLLVQEILFNTEDNTGLIDTLKQGGKINGNTQ